LRYIPDVTTRLRLIVALAVLTVVAPPTRAHQPPQPPPASSADAQRERWNRVFSEPRENIRTEANQFLVQVVRELKPGAALDIGMGLGRNALFLAREGWTVTGVDISDVAVQKARERAEAGKLPLTAVRENMFNFDYGRDRFDLVVFTYMGGEREGMADKITDALKAGGLLVIEHFLKQPTTTLGYEPGVLPKLYPRLEVLRYAEEDSNPDYNQQIAGRVVRFLARKKP
jgi:SAM-dependent methyltransferase